MSTAQTPIWVPIAVALLGMAGVIAAQLVNTWREDRRWKRETHREDLRWQRQRMLDEAKLNQEHATEWREVKIRIYGALIQKLHEYETTAYRAKTEFHLAEINQHYRKLYEIEDEVNQLVNEAQLIASNKLLEYLEAKYPLMTYIHDEPLSFSPDEERAATAENRRYAEEMFNHANKYRSGIISLVREELGVNPISISDARS